LIISRFKLKKMSRKYYDIISMKSKECDNCSSSELYYDIVKQNYKLLLQIIDNKTDNEFYDFFKKYISSFQFKKQYIAYIYNINQDGKIICNIQLSAINKFHNSVIDFIEKCCFISLVYGRNDYETSSSPIDERYSYYKELNTLLTDIFNISQKLKEEEQEKKEQKEKIKAKKKEVVKVQEEQEKKKKKKPISATMKKLVWNINIGEEIGKAKCLCCNSTDITQMSFNCGHIIAEANGGETIVSNLKPICQNCNSSMGTKNMEDFMKTLK